MNNGCTVNSVPVTDNNFVSVAVSNWFTVANPPLALCWSSVAPVTAIAVDDVLHNVLPSVTQVYLCCVVLTAGVCVLASVTAVSV